MLITMFTDAGYSPDLHRATWAMWAKANGRTERYSGTIKSPLDNVAEAELAAIANGLFVSVKRFGSSPRTRVICQTDSMEAISAINNLKHPRAHARLLVNSIWAFARQHSLTLDLRHVKGHKGTATPRNAVNTWCDRECSFLLKRLANEIQPELPLEQRA